MKNIYLFNRLRREAIASPKKAIILGILLLVAIAYWTPLMWSWISPKSTEQTEMAPTVAAAASQSQATSVVLPSQQKATTEPSKHSWRQINQWINTDTRMTRPGDLPDRHHPFDPVQPVTSDDSSNDQAKHDMAAQLLTDPASLGIVLTSTIVGPGGQAALVNGRTYQIGQTITITSDGQPIEFVLEAIRNDSVLLKRNNLPYEVHLAEPQKSGRLEITPLDPH